MTSPDLIGEVLNVTLTTGDTIRGTVMTISREQQVLVLLVDPNRKPLTVRMIRLPFIESFSLATDVTKDDHLPYHIAAGEALPSVADSEAYFKALTKKLKRATEKRSNNFQQMLDNELSIPIGAYEVFDKVARVYPETKWDDDCTAIVVTPEIVIVADPDWSKPTAKAVVASDDGLVGRIQKLIDSQ